MMEFYRYLEKEDYNDKLIDKDKKNWRYYSKGKMKQLHPDNNYRVIGEVNVNKKYGGEKYIINGDQKLKLQSLEKSNPFREKICGYMECSKEQDNNEEQCIEYVAVKKDQFLKSLLLLLLALLLAFGGIFWFINRDQGPIFDDSAIAYKMPDGVAANTDPNSIAIPGYGVLTMEKKNQEIYMALLNPEGNPCYFRYEILITDSGESLYKSELIKPGMAVTNVKLTKDLEVGTYEVTLLITTASLDDYTQELNGGAVETTLVVK